jgi:hypothetical protein
LLIVTNLLKHRSVVGWVVTNLTNCRCVLGFNIHQCTFVTKNMNMSQCSGLDYPSVHIRDEKQEYVVDTVLFVMFYENVAEFRSRNK